MSLRLTKTRSDLRQPRFQSSRAFTLVELLVAMAIISILGALLVGVAAVATETARRARTEQMVSRLHTLLVDYYEGFQNRRVALNEEPGGAGWLLNQKLSPQLNPNNYADWQTVRGQLFAAARLGAVREQMITEMPDHWDEVYLKPILGDFSSIEVNTAGQPKFSAGRSGLSNLMLRKLVRIANSTNSLTGNPNTLDELLANEHAECLYLVITLATGDGEARGLFSDSDIGDTDGDGAPEFLDGWGRPINYLRWAPGINSSSNLRQVGIAQLRYDLERRQPALSADEVNQQITRRVSENFDPFDPFRVQADIDPTDPRTWNTLILPYIWSDGPDEESGLLLPSDVRKRSRGRAVLTWHPDSINLQLGPEKPYFNRLPNPYVDLTNLDITGITGEIGRVTNPELAADNISNHTTATN